jgi:general secretion pathway protein D
VTRSRTLRAILTSTILAIAAGFVAPSSSFAQERSFPLNYERVEIGTLIERVGTETRRTIIFDDQVRGNVSIVAKRPVTEGEAWSILNESLSLLGFSLLPSTVDNWRISKVAEAVGEAPFVERVGDASGQFVTALIPLANAEIEAVLSVLRPLSGARVTLVPYEPSQSLIASGPEREIARLTTIADELDRVNEFELHFHVLRHRGVAEVEKFIEARLDAERTTSRQLQVWSDERTNSILYRGNEREISRLGRLLERIDQPVVGGGHIRVLRVRNRDPEELGQLIRDLRQPSRRASGVSARTRANSGLEGADFSIAIDRGSRSLVVRADPVTQNAIRDIFEVLDELPQLIAVDLTISELRTPRRFALGFGFTVPFSTGNNNTDINGIIVSSPTPGGFLNTTPNPQSTIFGRVTRDPGVPFTIDGGNGIEIPILQSGTIEGQEFTAQTEVLIQPSLILTAGEQHEIFVGTNVPVPVTDEGGPDDSTNGVLSTLSRTTRFEREDIGIRLAIDARAGVEGKIQLGLDIEISAVAPSVAGDIAQVGPTFIHQELTVTARLDDGETAVVAVNRQKVEVRGRSGVPWLSDIPFIGWLFSGDVENDQDVRLVIAAKASRISSPAELAADSIRRRLAFRRRNARDAALPKSDGPAFGVRVTTRALEDDAQSISQGLARAGHETVVHSWSLSSETFFDVYVVSLESMAEAAEIASVLSKAGWAADLVVFPTRS